MNLIDYKRKKGKLPKEDYGTIFVFKSRPSGVSEITEHLIWDVRISAYRHSGELKIPVYQYKLEESPFFVEIHEDSEYGVEQHLCSVINGDPWTASTWCSKNKNLLEELRIKEDERIKKYYPKQRLDD